MRSKSNPQALMPDIALSHGRRRDLAAYLATLNDGARHVRPLEAITRPHSGPSLSAANREIGEVDAGFRRGASPARAVGSRPGWRGWLSTVDHKTIGLRYMVTAFVFLLLGGVEALMMRLQLARPNATLLTPEQYNQLFTMHGVTMIFLYALPVLSAFRTICGH